MSSGPRLLGALLPPISCLLQADDEKLGGVHMAAVSQILSFATSSPTAFKEAASLMNQEHKDLMESSIRQAVADKGKANTQASTSKPQIALRSF
jgi:hypothetical protein